MIQPVSQININKYYNTKPVIFRKEPENKERSEKASVVSQSNLEDLRKRYDKMVIFLSTLVLAVSGACFLGNKSSSLKKKMPYKIDNFVSLKNDSKVPTLEECKSINKDLKFLLERQVSLNKAGKDFSSDFEDGIIQPNRFLLYGPPGVGKTFFSKIFSKTMEAEYKEILFSEWNSRWAGETTEKMENAFKSILNTAEKHPDKKFIVVFNEIDALVVPPDNLSNSSGTHWVSVLRERSTFLNYLEILREKTPNVTIIGTTNIDPKNNKLDRAAMSRFQTLIEVPYPDKECLYEAIKAKLSTLKFKDEFFTLNDSNLKELAQKMADRKCSFRNLDHIIEDSKSRYINDKLKNKDTKFNFDYLKDSELALQVSDGELEKVKIVNTKGK